MATHSLFKSIMRQLELTTGITYDTYTNHDPHSHNYANVTKYVEYHGALQTIAIDALARPLHFRYRKNQERKK